MQAPNFLPLDLVVELHVDQIEFFGGAHGIRDEGLLESAVIAPINYFNYENTKNLFDLAACYAFHIAKNHPFMDGNKRTALASALAFLKSNGMRVEIKQRVIFKATKGLAASNIGMLEYARMLREHTPLEFAFVAALFENKADRIIKPSAAQK